MSADFDSILLPMQRGREPAAGFACTATFLRIPEKPEPAKPESKAIERGYHVYKIISKLDAMNRTHAVARALEKGLIQAND